MFLQYISQQREHLNVYCESTTEQQPGFYYRPACSHYHYNECNFSLKINCVIPRENESGRYSKSWQCRPLSVTAANGMRTTDGDKRENLKYRLLDPEKGNRNLLFLEITISQISQCT